MIQPGRHKIHASTKVWTLDGDAWRSFPITRRTAAKVVIETPAGEVRIDRIPLERKGWALAHGTVYHLSRFALPADEESEVAA